MRKIVEWFLDEPERVWDLIAVLLLFFAFGCSLIRALVSIR
jgi:hypothetical protein